MNYIVTHPGPAHADDFIACCILLAKGTYTHIERREPTQEELDNPRVTVVDVGGRYEPAKMNFDHHQYKGGDSSFIQVLKFFDLHSGARKVFNWVEAASCLDTEGPFALAEVLQCPPMAVLAMQSPIEKYVLEMFVASGPVVRNYMYDLMRAIGRRMVGYIDKASIRYMVLAEVGRLSTQKGKRVVVSSLDEEPSLMLTEYCRAVSASISVCPDDRGGGWSLMRIDDDMAVDFTRIKDDPRVKFAHANGFIAKTKFRCNDWDLADLIAMSIKEG
jgi:hypothetical protein